MATPSHALSRGELLANQFPPTIPSIWCSIQLWGLGREIADHSAFLYGREGSSLPTCVPSNGIDNSESVVGVKPNDSDVVIRYQINELVVPGSLSTLLLNHTCTLVFMARGQQ